jgi:hypothetical protein
MRILSIHASSMWYNVIQKTRWQNLFLSARTGNNRRRWPTVAVPDLTVDVE